MMRIKKTAARKTAARKMAALGMAGLMAVAFCSPAWAHGHGHHRGAGQAAASTQAAVSQGDQCPVCTVEGCAEAGRHYHDGAIYCGYAHSSGYCDGSCGDAIGNCYNYHHHGCHY